MTTTPPQPATRRPWLHPWVHGLLVFTGLAVLVVAVIAGYLQMRRYSQQALAARLQQATLAIDFAARPNYLDASILNSILQEAQIFALQTRPGPTPGAPDICNYDCLRDPLDAQVLRDLARHYAAHASERNNAWIKGPISARRVYDPRANIQRIYLAVEFRRPAALVVEGESYYLIDADLVRLPGRYSARDAAAVVGQPLPGSKRDLLLIGGVDEPIPERAGDAWVSAGGRAALELADLLAEKPYARQIGQINLANFAGRRDPLAARIVLQTVYGTEVRWGLPLQRTTLERLYEITPAAKLHALDQIFAQYSRIDARAPWVDIRGDQAMIPKVADTSHPSEEPAPPRPPAPPPRRRPA